MYYFVVNPVSGCGKGKKIWNTIKKELDQLSVEYEAFLLRQKGEARTIAASLSALTQPFTLVVVGGDGTLNEVIGGLSSFINVTLGCIPTGSGNDFVRSFPDCDLSNLEAQIAAEERPIDLIHFNNQWSANICSAGLDSDVCKKMARYKHLPLVTGSGAYILALIATFFSPMGKQAHIVLDDGRVLDENILILVMSNGGFYGGGWNGAPKFNVEDGLMDLCIVRKINRLRILKVIGKYQKGLHVDDPSLQDCIIYTRCRSLTIDFEQPTNLNADGEMSESTHVEAAIVPLTLPLILPKVPQ